MAFTSARELKLWLWTVAVVVSIYATLAATPRIAATLAERNLLAGLWVLGLLVMAGVVIAVSVARRPRSVEVALGAGVIAAYGMIFTRLRATEERTHLFEYGFVALLGYQALVERQRQGGNVPAPAIVAIALTAAIGALDEVIQAALPNRVFDPIDIAFNALAAAMAVVASAAMARIARRRSPDAGSR